MSTSNIVNSLGLLLDIIGVLLIFLYGLPKWIPRDNEELIIDGGDISEEKAPSPRFDRHTVLNRAGLIFLLIGFALQLFSNFL